MPLINNTEYRLLDDILGQEGYRVGDDGSVWSRVKVGGAHPGKELQENWRKLKTELVKGYLRIKVARQKFLVHNLVLLAFVGPCPAGMQARHFPSNDRTNCRLRNLSYIHPKANAADRKFHGTHIEGIRSPKAKLTEEEVREIRRDYRPWNRAYSQYALGRKYGPSSWTIKEGQSFKLRISISFVKKLRVQLTDCFDWRLK